MQLTRHTDLALRLLIRLADIGDQRATIADVARDQDIPRTHLMKIANDLAHAGFIDATRGRGGGIRLAREAHDIRIGDVVAAMEPHCEMVRCSECRLSRRCTLPRHLDRALDAFLAVLNEQSLADITKSG
ncbi:Rrf2 family transcriptional regulator [Novosphingobium sp. KN65.2]|uniref:RrF2 family transcriptional regulator n=1 Tax=Novosphingobium sp. KN65.2 TaxID=1478134 RepID=UPI0005E864BA|nr:Rrf2 family transcriptional regulator [Novosphingobium sp. KN65.2]CDO38897.1 HTH-type transcriptional repressor nsrR [Novosphingobium sp. KN65.2]